MHASVGVQGPHCSGMRVQCPISSNIEVGIEIGIEIGTLVALVAAVGMVLVARGTRHVGSSSSV